VALELFECPLFRRKLGVLASDGLNKGGAAPPEPFDFEGLVADGRIVLIQLKEHFQLMGHNSKLQVLGLLCK